MCDHPCSGDPGGYYVFVPTPNAPPPSNMMLYPQMGPPSMPQSYSGGYPIQPTFAPPSSMGGYPVSPPTFQQPQNCEPVYFPSPVEYASCSDVGSTCSNQPYATTSSMPPYPSLAPSHLQPQSHQYPDNSSNIYTFQPQSTTTHQYFVPQTPPAHPQQSQPQIQYITQPQPPLSQYPTQPPPSQVLPPVQSPHEVQQHYYLAQPQQWPIEQPQQQHQQQQSQPPPQQQPQQVAPVDPQCQELASKHPQMLHIAAGLSLEKMAREIESTQPDSALHLYTSAVEAYFMATDQPSVDTQATLLLQRKIPVVIQKIEHLVAKQGGPPSSSSSSRPNQSSPRALPSGSSSFRLRGKSSQSSTSLIPPRSSSSFRAKGNSMPALNARPSDHTQCPLCFKMFTKDKIEKHAATCKGLPARSQRAETAPATQQPQQRGSQGQSPQQSQTHKRSPKSLPRSASQPSIRPSTAPKAPPTHVPMTQSAGVNLRAPQVRVIPQQQQQQQQQQPTLQTPPSTSQGQSPSRGGVRVLPQLPSTSNQGSGRQMPSKPQPTLQQGPQIQKSGDSQPTRQQPQQQSEQPASALFDPLKRFQQSQPPSTQTPEPIRFDPQARRQTQQSPPPRPQLQPHQLQLVQERLSAMNLENLRKEMPFIADLTADMDAEEEVEVSYPRLDNTSTAEINTSSTTTNSSRPVNTNRKWGLSYLPDSARSLVDSIISTAVGETTTKNSDSSTGLLAVFLKGMKTVVELADDGKELTLADGRIVHSIQFAELKPETPTAVDTTPTFVSYGDKVWHRLRTTYGITTEAFLTSLGLNSGGMTSAVSEGKSGSNFFFTADNKFIIKTISEEEFQFFKDNIFDYFQHMTNNPNSLLVRFFGLYSVTTRVSPQHMVVMERLCLPHLELLETYDLKGSIAGREASASESRNPKTILKDIDFQKRRKLYLNPQKGESLLKQIEADTEWLQTHQLMDYSLLLLVYKRPPRGGSTIYPSIREIETHRGESSLFRKEHGGYSSSGVDGQDGDEVYHLAIIDPLQTYNWRKLFETRYKGIFENEDALSCVEPSKYRDRFVSFLRYYTEPQKGGK